MSWAPFGRTTEPPPQPSPSPRPRPSRAAPDPGPAAAYLPREPARRLAVVTCMDSRLDPLRDLGLARGDAMVLRNAGATVSDDVERSLRVAHERLGVREVWLVGHSDCVAHGMARRRGRGRAAARHRAAAQRAARRQRPGAVLRLRVRRRPPGRATRMSAAPTSAAQPPAISR